MNKVRRALQEKIARYEMWKHMGRDGPIHTRIKHQTGIPYLRAALDRLDQGLYGVCVECEEEIPEQRMEAVPGAIRCVACQQEFESSQRR